MEIQSALLSAKQAARYLGISERLLWALTHPRGPIPCIRLGAPKSKCARVLYPIQALDVWIREQVAAQGRGPQQEGRSDA